MAAETRGGSGIIDPGAMETLLQPGPCTVSITMPVEPGQRDVRAHEARLRGLIDMAAARLNGSQLPDGLGEALVDSLHEWAATMDFAHHREPGLAVFATAAGQPPLVLKLPRPVEEAAIVGPYPHIKPLLPILAVDRRFNILAVSRSNVKLWSATPFHWFEIPLEALPMDAQAELDSLPAAAGAAGAEGGTALDDARLALMVADPRRIVVAVKAALGEDPAPIVLAADPHVAGEFMHSAGLRQLHPEPLHLNPFGMAPGELHAKALELMQPILRSELDGLLEQIEARLGTAEPTVGIRLEEILQGAHEARVDVAVVAEDEAMWGRFEPGHSILAHGHQGPEDEDLLNQVEVMTLRNGGRAYAAPRQRLPRQVPAAALYRF